MARTSLLRSSRLEAAAGDDAAQLRAKVQEEQPAFWSAVVADAEVAVRFRAEGQGFRSGWRALTSVLRLAWVTDAFFAQICYRAEVAARRGHVPVVPQILHHLAITSGQICIGRHVVMRPGVYLPHGQVVVDGLTLVEAGAVLRPFVTLGLVDGHVVGPHIGPHARIGTGAKIIGPVHVGERAQVGANAVVTADVPAGRTAVGVPARVLEKTKAVGVRAPDPQSA